MSAAGRVSDVLDPKFLADQLAAIQEGPEPALSDDEHAAAVAELAAASERISATGTARTAAVAGAPRPDAAFFPRSPGLSILQSTLETCILSRDDDVVEAPPRIAANPHLPDRALRAGAGVNRDFGPCDRKWIQAKVAEGIRLLRGKHDFPDERPVPATLGARARVVVVGDWGSGLASARNVGAQMRRALADAGDGVDLHAIHLGDVYYSGWWEEYQAHVLPYWPHDAGDATRRSWALNGNHDMYSGGHGYFRLLRDERFAGQAQLSVFELENEHWRIFGLDTSWQDHDLAGHQAGWVADRIDASGARPILLSHHQPFSVYSDQRYPLEQRLKAALAKRRLAAWLWGHEHRLVVYEPSERIGYPVCMGHGGIPVLVPEPSAPVPDGVVREFRGADVEGAYRWGLFGFAVLDFDGPKLSIRYVDEHGDQWGDADEIA